MAPLENTPNQKPQDRVSQDCHTKSLTKCQFPSVPHTCCSLWTLPQTPDCLVACHATQKCISTINSPSWGQMWAALVLALGELLNWETQQAAVWFTGRRGCQPACMVWGTLSSLRAVECKTRPLSSQPVSSSIDKNNPSAFVLLCSFERENGTKHFVKYCTHALSRACELRWWWWWWSQHGLHTLSSAGPPKRMLL